MAVFDDAGVDHPIREDIRAAQRAAWQGLAAAGSWWSGAERLAIAAEVRRLRSRRSEADGESSHAMSKLFGS